MIPLLRRRWFAPELTARNPVRTRIKIIWEEAVAEQIKIRHHDIGTAAKICAIYLQIGCPSENDEPLASDAAAQVFSGSEPERRTT
jgi:hypothetical protein